MRPYRQDARAVLFLLLIITITTAITVLIANRDEPHQCAGLRQTARANTDAVYQVWQDGQRHNGQPTDDTAFAADHNGQTPTQWKQALYDESTKALPKAGCNR